MKGPDLNLPILQRYCRMTRNLSKLAQEQGKVAGYSLMKSPEGITVVAHKTELIKNSDGDKVEIILDELEVEVFPWSVFDKDFDGRVFDALRQQIRQSICSQTGEIVS